MPHPFNLTKKVAAYQQQLEDGHQHTSADVDTFATTHLNQLVRQLEFNFPFQHKYGYIRDKRSGVESYPYPVKEG